LRRFARLLSALLIALLAYAAAGEGACAAEGAGTGRLAMVTAAHDDGGRKNPDKGLGCSHTCMHGHHHIDTATMADAKFARPEAGRELVLQASLTPPPHRPGSLERPPRI